MRFLSALPILSPDGTVEPQPLSKLQPTRRSQPRSTQFTGVKKARAMKRPAFRASQITTVSFCVASTKTRLSVTTKPPLAVWSEPVRSRAPHSTDNDKGLRVRVRGTSRALLRICPFQQCPGRGLVEVAMARLNYLHSDSAAGPPVNCDWLSRRLNILI